MIHTCLTRDGAGLNDGILVEYEKVIYINQYCRLTMQLP